VLSFELQRNVLKQFSVFRLTSASIVATSTEMRGLFLPISNVHFIDFQIALGKNSGFITVVSKLFSECSQYTYEKYFRGLPKHFSNSKFYSLIFPVWRQDRIPPL
jgi:hypothetical protein